MGERPDPPADGGHAGGGRAHTDARHGRGQMFGSGNVQHNYFGYPERLTRLPPIRPVTEWDPFDLDIWPVLTVPGGPELQGLPALPPYVTRQHDTDIDGQLTDGASRMIVVTGSSCTGKTRALYEAILRHDQMRDWGLLCPAGPEQLLNVATGDHIPPRTVLWLNDLDQYLLSPLGERIAEGLLDLLRQPKFAPVAIVATLWPTHWRTLTQDADGTSAEGHPQARRLLTGQARRIHMPEAFDRRSRQALLASADPRMAEAARLTGESGTVIQTLAGGPLLLDRYRHPDPESVEDAYEWAVLSAAIDARRLGLDPELPRRFLERAARGYLTPEMRLNAPADWADQGLRDATRKQRGVRALQPQWRTDDGGPADAYRMHDYLAQHGGASRKEELVPAAFWDSAAEPGGLTGPEYLALAIAAHHRFLYGYAHCFYRLAWTAGTPGAWESRLNLIYDQGRLDLIRAEAARGDPTAHRILVQEMDRHADGRLSAELRDAFDAAIGAGCEDLRVILADMLAADGPEEAAIQEYERVLAADPGADHARYQLCRLLIRLDRISEAIGHACAAPEPYRRDSYWDLVAGLVDHGLISEAAPLIRSALDRGELPNGMLHRGLADELAGLEGGEELLRELAAKRFGPAVLTLSRLSGHGDGFADWHLALLLRGQGRMAEAITVLRRLAADATSAPAGVPREEAARFIGLLEEAGDDEALHELVTSHRRLFDRPLADWCYRNKRRSDLEHLARHSGDKYVRKRLAWMLRDEGDQKALEDLASRSVAAHQVLISSLVEDGKTAELYRQVVLGDGDARRVLGNLIEQGDARIPVQTLRRNGLSPDGRISDRAAE